MKYKTTKKKKNRKTTTKKQNNTKIRSIVIKELAKYKRNNITKKQNKSGTLKEPSTNDLIKVILSQVVNNQKPSFRDSFSNRPQAYMTEIREQDATKKQEDLIKMVDRVSQKVDSITGSSVPPGSSAPWISAARSGNNRSYSDAQSDIIDIINDVISEDDKTRSNAYKKLENIVPAVREISNSMLTSRKKLEYSQKEIEALNSEAQDMNEVMQKMRNNIDTLNNENILKSKENKEIKTEFEKTKKDFNQLEIHMKMREKVINKNEQLINKYENEIKNIQNDIEQNSNNKLMTHTQLNRMKTEQNELNAKISEMQVTNADLHKEMKLSKKHLNTIKKELNETEEALREASDALNDTNSKVQDIKTELEINELVKQQKNNKKFTRENLKLFFDDSEVEYEGLKTLLEFRELFFRELFHIDDFSHWFKEREEPKKKAENKKDDEKEELYERDTKDYKSDDFRFETATDSSKRSTVSIKPEREMAKKIAESAKKKVQEKETRGRKREK